MSYLLSPPTSPYLQPQSTFNSAVCGACDRALGPDWFCSNCHTKCNSCNRFLSGSDYCSRCWSFDPIQQHYSRKNNNFKFQSSLISHYHASFLESRRDSPHFSGLPSPSNSTGSEPCNPKTSHHA